MQVIKSKTVVKLSMQELADVIKFYVHKVEGFLIDELEIEVDGYEIVESEKVVSKNREEDHDDDDELDGWKFVPLGWDKEEPPEELEPDTKVNVVFRDLSTYYNRDTAYLDFSQSGHPFDIIRYQLVK